MATKTKSKGQTQREATPVGQNRLDFAKLYARGSVEVVNDQQEFRFKLHTVDSRKRPVAYWINDMLTSVSWTDEARPIARATPMTGTATAVRPHQDGVEAATPNIMAGDRIEAFVRYGDGGDYVSLWEMLVDEADTTLSTGEQSLVLVESSILLQRSTDSWHYVTSKRKGKPKGWLCHEIAKDVAKRYKIPLGKVQAGHHHIEKLGNGQLNSLDPLSVIAAAYAQETKYTGRQFIFRWGDKNGRQVLNITLARRNPLLYAFGDQVREATLSQKHKSVFTAFTARSTTKASPSTSGGVTMVGDSITVQSKHALQKAIPGITIYAQGSKHLHMTGGPTTGGASGISLLNAHKSALKGTVVIALGTNDEGTSKSVFGGWIDDAMDIIGKDRAVVWVNTTNNPKANAAMSAAKSRHSNITVANWKSVARLQPGDVHPTTGGQTVFARVVKAAVGGGSSGSSSSKKAVSYRSSKAVAQYGFIHRDMKANPKDKTRAAVLARGKREMAKALQTVPSASFSTSGIAAVRAGDAVELNFASDGFQGIHRSTDRHKKTGIAWVQSAVHTLSGGDYTMEVTVNWVDPLDPDTLRKARDAALRAQKGKSASGKKAAASSGSGKSVAPPVGHIVEHSNGYNGGHDGVDLITTGGVPIYAICDAEVIDVRGSGWWGLNARGSGGHSISDGDGIVQLKCLTDVGPFTKGMHFGYGHSEHHTVKVGDRVKAGQKLGLAGYAMAWHVHFMANSGSTTSGVGDRDPWPYISYAIQHS